ncbi:MAG: AraC-like DNA-binding protein [Oleispira sp.]|jgi:AraC-like DNA-binding protein
MQNLTRKRSITSVLLMINVAKRKGISREQCLNGTGITDEMLVDHCIEINPEQELQLIENLIDEQSNQSLSESLALEIGGQYHLTTYGIFGFAISTSSSIRSAIEIGVGYLPLSFAFSTIFLREEEHYAYLVLDAEHIPEKVRRFVVERDLAAMVNILREVSGQNMPLQALSLRWPENDENLYHNIYAKKPNYCESENSVAFDRLLLNTQLPTANEHSQKFLLAQCQALLQKRHGENSVALTVRNCILSRIDQRGLMETIASERCISLRTLRRQLSNEGTSFRALMDEVKETLAIQLIQETAMTMEQISLRLGYSDTANFFHAFKRWTGRTPKHYRP